MLLQNKNRGIEETSVIFNKYYNIMFGHSLSILFTNDFHTCYNYSLIYIRKMKLCHNFPLRNISFIQHYLTIARFKIYVWFSCVPLKNRRFAVQYLQTNSLYITCFSTCACMFISICDKNRETLYVLKLT